MTPNSSPSPNDTYTSPLAERNASKEMLQLWSPRHKFNTWRRIWLAVAEAQHELGLPVSKEQVEELRAVVERPGGITDAEIELAKKYERELRHDVMAHVHALGDSCPKAKGIIHLGMTSQDVVCNADLMILFESIRVVVAKCVRTVVSLGDASEKSKHFPTLAFTHYQPAQPVTVGRRIAFWAHDLAVCHSRLLALSQSLRLKGLSGATGTQASFEQLFAGLQPKQTNRSPKEWVLLWVDHYCFEMLSPPPGGSDSAKKFIEAVIHETSMSDPEEFLEINVHQVAKSVQNVNLILEVKIAILQGYIQHLKHCRMKPSRPRWMRLKVTDRFNGTVMRSLHSSIDWPNCWPNERVIPLHWEITGQTYPRVIDTFILADLASVASVLHKIATDIRLLSNRKEIDEPFESKQIGSSAMPYKRNPMRCERICGLTRFVMNLVGNAYDTAATQWLERTLDDSSNRRLSLPEAFLALDGALDLMHNVASGLVVHEATVRKNLMAELPFMATENLLMECVKLGGDRQHYHEVIRQHAQAAGFRVKQEGADNDLIDRLKADKNFWSTSRGGPLSAELNWDGLLDPMKYIGRSVEQTERFITDVVEPLRAEYADQIAALGDSGPKV